MIRISPLLLVLAMLLACPGEPIDTCVDEGCPDDAYCDLQSEQCRQDIVFVDGKLEACVREALDQPEGAITVDGARGLNRLECPDRGILDLDGVEHLRGLTALSAWENDIQDVENLATATTLRSLQLGHNAIIDISPLAGLQQLERLGLGFNVIDDIAPLARLTGLRWLNLDHNAITDVSVLGELKALTWLSAEHNPASDWGVLGGLRSQGCEVYKKRPQPASAATLDDDRRSAPSPRAVRALGYRLLDDGALQLLVRTEHEVFPVRREDAGRLALEGERVTYTLLGRRVDVGAVRGERIELCQGPDATVCQLAVGRKGPGGRAPGLGSDVAFSASLILRSADGSLGGAFRFKDGGDAVNVLEPYALASPNQHDAGSCNFMANTGAMELLMNQHLPLGSFDYLGDTDLSERFLMNAEGYAPRSVVPYTITDVIYTFNHFGGSLLSRDYPFTIGYIRDEGEDFVRSTASDPDAYASCRVNWLDDLPFAWHNNLTPTPAVDRTLLFVDPDLNANSVWNVGIIDEDVIERIKFELRTKHAPVIVVYNHYMFWHSVIVLGYDDSVRMGSCPMVQDSLDYFDQQGAGSYSRKIRAAMASDGGCRDSGVFYVRDSIYSGSSDEPMYDYGSGFRERYSQRVVLHTYDWAKYLGNHVYTVHR
ncbi:MAG: leucine-rich repeat domain-containing protein [Pseudomonadota bacterium]